jgi:hypothetical protein
LILSELLTADADLHALARELDIPVHAGLQHQGDVSIVPASMTTDYRRPRRRVPPTGVAIVRGEATGNTHLLLAAGRVLFDHHPARADDLTLGFLRVCENATAYLDHPEHGNSGIAPGDYVIRGKRELAHWTRRVRD